MISKGHYNEYASSVALNQTTYECKIPSYSFSLFLKRGENPITKGQWWEYEPVFNTTPPIYIFSTFPLHKERNRIKPAEVTVEERPDPKAEGSRIKLYIYIKQKIIRKTDLYLHPFVEYDEAVAEVYHIEGTLPLFPENWWLGFLNVPDINRERVGQADAVIKSYQDDLARFGKEAMGKASETLKEVAEKLGWEVTRDEVRTEIKIGENEKKQVAITRNDCACFVAGDFRCVTSDNKTPKDDQVMQKMLTISSKDLRKSVSTLKDL